MDGGWKSPEPDWANIQNLVIAQMVKLESALKLSIQALKMERNLGRFRWLENVRQAP